MPKLNIDNLCDFIYFGQEDFEFNVNRDAFLYESRIKEVDELNTF